MNGSDHTGLEITTKEGAILRLTTTALSSKTFRSSGVDSLLRLHAFAPNLRNLFTFEAKARVSPDADGWHFYDKLRDYKRLGLIGVRVGSCLSKRRKIEFFLVEFIDSSFLSS